MVTIEARIQGIPCQVQLDYYEPVTPAYRRGHPDNWEPESGGELRWSVLDRRGYPAPWLVRKLTDKDADHIEHALLKAIHH